MPKVCAFLKMKASFGGNCLNTKVTRSLNRLFSLILATIMVLSMIPSMQTDAEAYAAALDVPKLTGNQAQDVANIALSQLGYSEARNGGTVYGAWWTGINKGYDYTYSGWCAMFACWCANQAGAGKVAYDNKSAQAESLVSYLKSNGKVETSFSSKPQIGDFIFFGNKRKITHVAVVVNYDSDRNVVTFVGGNQSDKVKKTTAIWSAKGRYGNQYVMGYARPNYAKTEKPDAPKPQLNQSGYGVGESAVISWDEVSGAVGYSISIRKNGKIVTKKDLGSSTSYTLENLEVGKYKVNVTSSNGYISSKSGTCEFTVYEVKPAFRIWVSDVPQGAAVEEYIAGENYYLCYELYDGLSDKKIDSLKQYNYTVRLRITDSEGNKRFSEKFYQDTASGSFYFKYEGNYTINASVTGDFEASQSLQVAVGENAKNLHASDDDLVVTLEGDASTTTVYIWTSGYADGETSIIWQRNNANVSCSLGQMTADGRYPFILSANSSGTTQIFLASKISGSNAISDTITLTVTVDAQGYSISYDANGGDGAPDAQVKTQGVNLTLQTDKPQRDGFIFLGWATSADAKTAMHQPGTVFLTDEHTTLYAVWSATYLCGDANGDGTVNIKDWNCLYEHSTESTTLTDDALLFADVNGDGKVNLKDWNRLCEHICEIDPLW